LAVDFPERSGVAGQATEQQHPGAADHGGHSVGAADPGLRARSGAPGRNSAAAGRHRGCHYRRDGDQLARVGRAAPAAVHARAERGWHPVSGRGAWEGHGHRRGGCDGPQVASVLGDQEPGRAWAVVSPARGQRGHVQAAAAGVAQRQGDAVRVQPDLRVPSSVHARRPGVTSLQNDPCSPVIGDRTTWAFVHPAHLLTAGPCPRGSPPGPSRRLTERRFAGFTIAAGRAPWNPRRVVCGA
jgi:hypothetical protein